MGINKTIRVITVLTVILVCITFGGFFCLGMRLTALEDMINNLRVVDQVAGELRAGLLRQNRLVREYALNGSEEARVLFQDVVDEREGLVPRDPLRTVAPGRTVPLLQLVEELPVSPEVLNVLRRAKAGIDELTSVDEGVLMTCQNKFFNAPHPWNQNLVHSVDKSFVESQLYHPEFLRKVSEVVLPLNQLRSVMHQQTERELAEGRNEMAFLMAAVFLSLLGVFGFLSLLLGYWRSNILLPLAETRQFAEQLASGDLAATIPHAGRDEIGLLRQAILAMAEALRARLEALKKAEQWARSKADEAQAACQQAEEGLSLARDASRAKSEFLSRMSHEIRTPMNTIIGMSYLCLQKALDSTQKEYVSKIHSAGNNLLGIINDILDYSRIDAGKTRLIKAPFRTLALLDSLTDLATQQGKEKQVEMIFEVGDDVPLTLVGDMLRLTQVMTHLTNNALKFTEKGEVVVSVTLLEDAGDRVRLRFAVQDSGIGINEDQQSRIFQSFSQADSSMTRHYGGLGLGLSIVNHLVELMGGRVQVQSRPGEGSLFYFELYLGKGSTEGLAAQAVTLNFQGLRALVVDDSAVARRIFVEMLESFGMAVTDVDSGEAALDILAAAPGADSFALIVLDWKMGGIDGVETLTRLRVLPGMALSPPVLLVSAYSVEDVYNHCEHIPNVQVLPKPVNKSVFFEHVCALMGSGILQEGPVLDATRALGALQRVAGCKVLLVEDNELNQQIAREMLESVGIVVSVAENGQEGLDAVLAHDFDLVLMDVQMPVMDGLEATRRIRAAGRNMVDLPIVALTAHAAGQDREKSLQAGINEHLTKPISPESLYGSLLHWLGGGGGQAGQAGAGAEAPAVPPASASPQQATKREKAVDSLPLSQRLGQAQAADQTNTGQMPTGQIPTDQIPTGQTNTGQMPKGPINRGQIHKGMTDTGLPLSLPGLNIKAGIANVINNKALYLNLLCRCVDKYSGSPHELLALLEEGRLEEASRLVHTVKGVAANLGATDLAAAARDLEKDLLDGVSITKDLALYEKQLEVLLQSVNTLALQCGLPQAAHTGRNTLSAEQQEDMRSLLQDISERMQRDWGAVSDALGARSALWEQSVYAEEFRALVHGVDDFDVHAVQSRASSLQARLKA